MRKVRIAGIYYKVKEVDPKYADNNMGKMNAIANTIYINPSSDINMKNRTLLHECIHWMWRNSGMDNLGVEKEEQLTAIIESGMYAFIRENKDLVKEWMNA